VHFDVVEVSGTNQYKVSPAEFVSTTFPLMVFVASGPPAALDEAGLDGSELAGAGLDAAAAGGLPLPLPLLTAVVPPELPHAATTSATAASPVAPNIFRIRRSPPHRK
jgi:hypothetical protein